VWLQREPFFLFPQPRVQIFLLSQKLVAEIFSAQFQPTNKKGDSCESPFVEAMPL
jgi:hypothetical protein